MSQLLHSDAASFTLNPTADQVVELPSTDKSDEPPKEKKRGRPRKNAPRATKTTTTRRQTRQTKKKVKTSEAEPVQRKRTRTRSAGKQSVSAMASAEDAALQPPNKKPFVSAEHIDDIVETSRTWNHEAAWANAPNLFGRGKQSPERAERNV